MPGSRLSYAYAALGTSAILAYALPLPALVDTLAMGVVGLSTSVAMFLGPVLHRPKPSWPWRCFGVGGVAFLLGALVRPWAATGSGAQIAAADAFSIPGYLLLIIALTGLARARRVDLHALTDGITASMGAALLSLTFFALPAAEVSGRPAWISGLAAVYPVLDVVVLLLLLNIAFTSAVTRPAFRLLALGIGSIFVGDLGYGFIGRTGRLVGPHWLDLPYLGAYVLFGVAVLHPTMAHLSSSRRRPVQAWSLPRLTLVIASLAVPPVLLVAQPPDSPALRAIFAGTSLCMVAALLLRSVVAVRAYTRSEEGLVHRATHDALTDLANRERFVDGIEDLLGDPGAPDAQVAVVLFDLDSFKIVNDSWGHGTGDALLVDVAQRLRGLLSPGDLAARTGGNEFAVARRITRGYQEAGGLAALVRDMCASCFVLHDTEVTVTSSVGVTVSTPGASAESVVRDADTAMYRAKGGGRDCTVVFDATMRDVVRVRVEMELALRHALSRQQFSVNFMPIVDLETEALIGLEALVRWDHPRLGRIAPTDFIPMAEDTGLIVPIGAWVLGAAAAQVTAWRAERPDLAVGRAALRLSVNVSARQLRDGGLVQTVVDVLAATGLPADRLCLEITESAILAETETAVETLEALVALGVSVSVDDFGTGYSSLGYLRRFPVDEVKIDREFVAGLGSDTSDAEIVRAVTAMGHALGLAVVAEGVETIEQRDMLRVFGVDRAQGYLYGKPLPAEEITFAAPALQAAGGNS